MEEKDKGCKNCKYWEKYHPKQVTGTCRKAESEDSLAFADDGYYNGGMLTTQPNFYCNQWEEKGLESND